jgi:RNA polymerase sigma factor (sigma-70 family)
MAIGQMSAFFDNLRRAALRRDEVGLSDGQLLDAYVRRREEAAFAALVHRHGPMVWGVCRRVLGNNQDAEDAFQAAFLVLVRKAAAIVPRESIANFLYGVARLTAVKARAMAVRRKTREKQMKDIPEPTVAERGGADDLLPLLDQELGRLPDKYRSAIVLCDLEGKSYKEAARQLGCPEGTLSARLARGRTMLAKRLARHGLAVTGGTLTTVLSESASAGVPASVVSSTIKAASVFAAGQAAAAGAISVKVAALTEGVLKTMLLTKLKSATAVLLMATLLCGAGILALHAKEGKKEPVSTKQAKDDDKLKETLLELDKQLWDASTKGDTKVHEKLLAENYLSIWAIDDRSDRAASLETAKRYRFSDRTMRDVEILRVSKDAAVLTYVCSYKVSVDNEEPRALPERRVSRVWGKRHGRWVVVFAQAMSGGE